MKKGLIPALYILPAFLLLSSCIVAVVNYSDKEGVPPADEFRRSEPLAPGGTVSLENINGNIEIYGWEREEVLVTAEKTYPRPFGKKVQVFGWGYYPLPKIDIDRFEDFIKIRTEGSKDRRSAEVHYFLSVPQAINLKSITCVRGNILVTDVYGEAFLDLKEGDIEVGNFSGSLNVALERGKVRASLTDLRKEDEIRIQSQEGDITLFLQPEVKAIVEGSAPNGSIFSDFPAEEPLPAKKLRVQIGEDGALLRLSALNGDIRINKIR